MWTSFIGTNTVFIYRKKVIIFITTAFRGWENFISVLCLGIPVLYKVYSLFTKKVSGSFNEKYKKRYYSQTLIQPCMEVDF